MWTLDDLFTQADVDAIGRGWGEEALHLRTKLGGETLAALGVSLEALFELRGVETRSTVLDPDAAEDLYFSMPCEHARRYYERGFTVCYKSLDRAFEKVGAIAADLGRRLRLPAPAANGYLSPDGRGFGVHYDRHVTFVVQLLGSKTWYFSRSPAAGDPGLHYSHHARPSPAELETRTLSPGDVLCLPAACWHHAVARGPSFALTFFSRPRSALMTMLERFEPNRIPALDPHDVGQHGIPERVGHAFTAELERLRAWLADVTIDDYWAAWADSLDHGRSPSPRVPTPVAGPLGLEDHLEVPRGYPLDFHRRRGSGGTTVVVHGAAGKLSLEEPAFAVLVEIARRRAFTGAVLLERVGSTVGGWTALGPLLERLLQIGAIVRPVLPTGTP